MEEGTLSYDFGSERYEIAFDDGGRMDLHCDNTFQIKIGREWKSTRIEYDWESGSWYLVGIKDDDWSTGSRVRS